ncbi:MAG: aminotransferase class I/II-fold pyridoxal phosphate-dependent enzyme, partial [Eubacterium sp.]|nr:aminotransferase class I/II-fold pyridoxal phosphate-dependent enzyme [Eubacterium sp.]
MVSFVSDYIAGAHPEILKRLTETNLEPLSGYGTDKYCKSAKEKIAKLTDVKSHDIEFLSGGTQTNAVIIAAMLNDYEGVIAAKTGHISLHEAGAVEYTGHKVIELEQKNGKLYADSLKKYLSNFFADENREHMVIPGMVYISYPTEYGTLYSKAELTAVSKICREYGLKLFIDGARLGYGLMSNAADLGLK